MKAISSALLHPLLLAVAAPALLAAAPTSGLRVVPAAAKVTVSRAEYPGLTCPNPRGWYHSVATIADTPEGLVACYRLSDSHTALLTHIMVAHSQDGGRTWIGHRSISHRNAWEHQRVWVAPQMSRLKDGRLVIIADLGHRTSHDNWPMLTHWQKPSRGMWNYLLWSSDHGRTWSEPQKIDDIGGEPSYLLELSNGTLVFTRTESATSPDLIDGPMPWGDIYYKNTAVFSDDRGKTWTRTSPVTDAPFQGDCEVGLVELEPGHVLAVTRIGYAGQWSGSPSRFVHSRDFGRTWEKPILAPIYAQRAAVAKLASGKLLVTYRNASGTQGSDAFVWDASETFRFEPNSYLWDESRAQLAGGVLRLRGDAGPGNDVRYSLYPVFDHRSRVELEAELRLVSSSEQGGALLGAGLPVFVDRDGVRLGAKRTTEAFVDATGARLTRATAASGDATPSRIALDTTQWHRFRLVREGRTLSIFVDGELKLKTDTAGRHERLVTFATSGAAVTEWRSVRGRIENPQDQHPLVEWAWDAVKGFPDQFRRDRVVRLDYSPDSGYSGWAQRPDGSVVILDYTNEHPFKNATWHLGPQPFLRAYLVTEKDLVR